MVRPRTSVLVAASLLLGLGGAAVVLALPAILPPGGGPNATGLANCQLAAPQATALGLASALSSAAGAYVISDGSNLTAAVTGNTSSTLADRTQPDLATLVVRSYLLTLHASVSSPATPVRILTHPVTNWEFTGAMPWGADNLPPLADWSYAVWKGSVNDTTNWSLAPWSDTIERSTTWTDATYTVIGRSSPIVYVNVTPSLHPFGSTSGVGFVLNNQNGSGPVPTGDPDYLSLGASLTPSVVRFGLVSSGAEASWNPLGYPKFNFSGFDQAAGYADALGAPVLLTLPVGSWGDGNLLPSGMPLATTLPITHAGSTGYLPTVPAYVSYIDAVVNHTIAAHEPVRYWSVGNEMPLLSPQVVTAYDLLFNAAASVIHSELPGALVGSDVMTNQSFLTQFAQQTVGVGFLSYHFYPAVGLNIVNGQYCPPTLGAGTPTPQLFTSLSGLGERTFYAPHLAQTLWHNATGNWLPILDAETNLNGIGGSIGTTAQGTDPRQQSLVAAAWLGSALIEGSGQNLSALTYFTLTGPSNPPATPTSAYGGWGFGMSAESGHDQDVRYAPYWALELWGSSFRAGGAPVGVGSSDPSVVDAYAAHNGSNLSVVLVNQVESPATVVLHFAGTPPSGFVVRTLDGSSYQEPYDPATHSVSLVRSGIATSSAVGGSTVTIRISGYGLASISDGVDTVTNGSGNRSTNSSGSGTQGSGSSGSGSSAGSGTAGSPPSTPGGTTSVPLPPGRPYPAPIDGGARVPPVPLLSGDGAPSFGWESFLPPWIASGLALGLVVALGAGLAARRPGRSRSVQVRIASRTNVYRTTASPRRGAGLGRTGAPTRGSSRARA